MSKIANMTLAAIYLATAIALSVYIGYEPSSPPQDKQSLIHEQHTKT